MATVRLEHVSKTYPNGARAVADFDLDVADGELVVLVGPSGSGKTTVLRMIAGLEEITAGTIRIGERVVNELDPRDRDIAMVFQNYALYPHMTVAENIGFSLQLRKLPKKEVRSRIETAAEILGLTDYLGRKPSQLSGGQRQRVAMGRAIVRNPAAFLMDEPLSNLDAKLRVQMRAEISRIQRRLAVATIYVTHDQTEAMTLGDRVAVMRDGELQQIDSPQVLYDQPFNTFVAAFIGSPAMNLYEATLAPDGKGVLLGEQMLPLPAALADDPATRPYFGREVVVGIRPEHLGDAALDGAAPGGARLEGEVDVVEALGAEKLIHFRTDVSRVHLADAIADSAGEADALGQGEVGERARSESVARVVPASALRPGDRAVFVVDVSQLHLFDAESGVGVNRAPAPTGT